MTALTTYRNTARQGDRAVLDLFNVPVDASVVCHQGGIIVLTSGISAVGNAGNARPGRVSPNDIAIGVMQTSEGTGVQGSGGNNSTGAAGAVRIDVRAGTFKFANSAAGDAIAQANVGQLCYIVDDQTVALGDGFGARSVAGIIEQVDSDGVWVQIGLMDRQHSAVPNGVAPAPGRTLCIPVTYASLANGQLMGALNLPVAGRVLSMQLVTAVAGTGAGATATLTPRLTQPGGAASAITGLTLVPTLANTTPVGNVVAQAAPPSVVGTGAGGSSFFAGAKLDIQASAVTVFTAGSGVIIIDLA